MSEREKIVEVMARGWLEAECCGDEESDKHMAHVALTTLEAAGYVVVPKAPNNAMLKAAAKSMSPEKRPTKKWVSCSEKHAIRYRAMIAAGLAKGEDND